MLILEETHLKYKNKYKLAVWGWKKLYLANTKQKKLDGAVLIQNKVDFKIRQITEEEHFILIKWSIFLKDINILNLSATNSTTANILSKTDITKRRNKQI